MTMADETRQTGNRWVDFAPAGPGTVGGRYLRKFWHPVAMSRDLDSGKAMPIQVMGERFTLYRGAAGTPHVVGFRCAHRSAQLSIGRVVDDCIQCMYHGWKYDGDGNCVERPGEKQPGPFAEANIPAYPTGEHLGLVEMILHGLEPVARKIERVILDHSHIFVALERRKWRRFAGAEIGVDDTKVLARWIGRNVGPSKRSRVFFAGSLDAFAVAVIFPTVIHALDAVIPHPSDR